MKKPWLAMGWVLVLWLLVVSGCQSPRGGESREREPFSLVQLCDPQIGWEDYSVELGRLRTAVEQINRLQPDLVVICGDLVNSPTTNSYADFNATTARLSARCYCAPGNHDLGNVPTPRSLALYRQSVGRDYYTFAHKGYRFVVVNAQLWKVSVPGESQRQDAWLKRTLESAAGHRQPVIVVSHYLPYEKEPGEPEAYFNLPIAKRQELLDLFERCGVVAILAGHTHKTIVQDYHGIQIVCSETTSKNFDQRPFGFRVWHFGGARPFPHSFVPLATTPPP